MSEEYAIVPFVAQAEAVNGVYELVVGNQAAYSSSQNES